MIRTLLLLALLPSVASAVPLELTHQGRLLDSTGAPLATTENVTVKLFDAPASGNVVFEETQSITFDNGYYTLAIGADESNPLLMDAFESDDLYLGLELGSGPVGDRVRVRSVPFAVRASDADTAITATNVSGGTVDASEILIDGSSVITADGISWDSLIGIPDGLADGDSDALSGLVCDTEGHAATWDGSAWTCGPLSADVITTGQLSLDRLPVGTDANTLAAGDHTHGAGDIVSGVLDFARVPVGDTDTTVARGDHQHSSLSGNFEVGGTLTLGGGSCDDSNAGALSWDADAAELLVCHGSEWKPVWTPYAAGEDASVAGESCKELSDGGANEDGIYWIDPDGAGTGQPAFEVWCEMTFNGGGWLSVYNMEARPNNDTSGAAAMYSSLTNREDAGVAKPTDTTSGVLTNGLDLSAYTEVVYGWAPSASADVDHYGTYTRSGGLADECYLTKTCPNYSVVTDFTIYPSGAVRELKTGSDPNYPHVGLGFSGQIITWGYDLNANSNGNWGNWYDQNACCNAGNDGFIRNNSDWHYVIYVR